MDVNDAAVVKQLLKQLLAVQQPELGARLKQRLIAAFVRDGLGRFDERTYGFKSFKDYLRRQHAEIVTIQEADGKDIAVSLRQQSAPSLANHEHVFKTSPRIRSEIWIAFANPDENRKRFFDRENAAVIHFLDRDATFEQKSLQKSPQQYVEIRPVPGNLQDQWMREFLNNSSLDQRAKEALEPLVQNPYSNATNAAFTRALGIHGDDWRTFRTQKMVSHIEEWARTMGIPMSTLAITAKQSKPAEKHVSQSRIGPSIKEKAIKILDLLNETDIEDVVIPILVSTLLIKQNR